MGRFGMDLSRTDKFDNIASALEMLLHITLSKRNDHFSESIGNKGIPSHHLPKGIAIK